MLFHVIAIKPKCATSDDFAGQTPVIIYIAKSGALLERMAKTGVDIVSLDWTVTIDEARQRMGNKVRNCVTAKSSLHMFSWELMKVYSLHETPCLPRFVWTEKGLSSKMSLPSWLD
jgi:hypothetical protein